MRSVVACALLLALAGVSCGEPAANLTDVLQVTEVTTGWFDAGLIEGHKNKLVPSVSLRLKNAGDTRLASVQLNAVFRRVGEGEEWGGAFVQAIGRNGLSPGASTNPIVMRSTLGYTGVQPRVAMLQNREFVDAQVQVFGKHGSAQWVKLAEHQIQRQLLVR